MHRNNPSRIIRFIPNWMMRLKRKIDVCRRKSISPVDIWDYCNLSGNGTDVRNRITQGSPPVWAAGLLFCPASGFQNALTPYIPTGKSLPHVPCAAGRGRETILNREMLRGQVLAL